MLSERQIVGNYLKSNKLIKQYSEGLNQPVRIVYEYFRREKKELKMKDWAALYLILNLIPRDFGIDKKLPTGGKLIPKDSLQKPILSYKSWEANNEDESNKTYSNDYYSKILKTFESCKEELFIYRYFNNKRVIPNSSSFFAGYEEYYQSLEKLISKQRRQNKNFEYKRIMAPPIGVYSLKERYSKTQFMEQLVTLLFPSSLNHCLRMLSNKFSDYTSLYLLTQPRRLYNLAIVDSSEKLLTEMYMLEPDGMAIPDIVNTYTKFDSNEIEQLIIMHHEDLSKISRELKLDYCIKLNLESLKSGIMSALLNPDVDDETKRRLEPVIKI